jgi:ABC-2 type transport system ATP-binding protein
MSDKRTPPPRRDRATARDERRDVATASPVSTPQSAAALETLAVTKEYGDLVALAPLDLRIEPTQTVALIGHNGSGKTTLMRMAAGLLDPSDGSVLVHGHPAGSLPARAALSYLSDQPTFYEDLSVWEHLDYTAQLHHAGEWEQRGADLLGHLGIYERADDLPVTFSRGLRQKAQIAIGLVRPFALLLVDIFDEARSEGATLVVATHELSFVDRVDRVIALRNGEVIHDGDASGIDINDLVT